MLLVSWTSIHKHFRDYAKPGLDGASCDGGRDQFATAVIVSSCVLILPLRQALPYIRQKLRETGLMGWLVVSGKCTRSLTLHGST